MTITSHLIGHKVIVRSNDSGVHHGTLVDVEGSTVRLTDSRRLWQWHTGGTGISLSEVAICGIDHKESKITMMLPDIIIFGTCEIIPTHGMADATIEGAAVYKP
jgi:hypothetical protein